MYAAAKSGDDVSSPGNVDLFDAAGLAKYLVTEVVVETGKAAERRAFVFFFFSGGSFRVFASCQASNPKADSQGFICFNLAKFLMSTFLAKRPVNWVLAKLSEGILLKAISGKRRLKGPPGTRALTP